MSTKAPPRKRRKEARPSELTAAALGLYREHRGARRVVGVVYSHSHVDHFGGAQYLADKFHATLVMSDDWNQPRCWSLPSRYMSH